MTNPVFGQTVHGVVLCGTSKNPVKGQNSFHSQGSFYFDVKMIKRGFSFSFSRGGNLPPVKNAKRFSVIPAHLRGYNRDFAAR